MKYVVTDIGLDNVCILNLRGRASQAARSIIEEMCCVWFVCSVAEEFSGPDFPQSLLFEKALKGFERVVAGAVKVHGQKAWMDVCESLAMSDGSDAYIREVDRLMEDGDE